MKNDPLKATRAPFVEAVRSIKKAHGLRLSQPLSPRRRDAFISDALCNHDIVAHLTRDLSELPLAAGLPSFALPAPGTGKDKAAKDASDYHEMKLYALLGQQRRVPFRGEMQLVFTKQGACGSEFERIFEAFAAEALPMRHVVTRPMRLKYLRHLIMALARTPLPQAHQPRFAMMPIFEPDHAMAVVTIYEPTTRTPLAVVFINSLRDAGRFDHVAHALHSAPREKPLPLLDASHCLQASSADFNCAIYSYHLLRCVMAMLRDESVAQRVMQLARRVSHRDLGAVEPLRRVFSEELKAHLPQYYDASGAARSQEALAAYHTRARWELGALGIALLAQSLQTRQR